MFTKFNRFIESIENDLTIMEIKMILTSFSKESYMVGGCVRDAFIGLRPKDIDFVTDIRYERLAKIFEDAGWKVKTTGQNFLVMNVIKNGREFEIANFRKDDKKSDGRRPDSVQPGNIYEDAERRDFTVNTGYVNLTNLELVDPTGKFLKDIQKKELRFVGKAKDRIKEDYLRVFRFYRFIEKGFIPNRNNLRTVRSMFNEAIEKTSSERIRGEIEKMVYL